MGYDKDRSFLSVEISGDDLYFQAISRTGVTVDSGTIRRPVAVQASALPQPAVPPHPCPEGRGCFSSSPLLLLDGGRSGIRHFLGVNSMPSRLRTPPGGGGRFDLHL